MFQKIVTFIELVGLIAFFCVAGLFVWSKTTILAVVFFVLACGALYGGIRTVFCGSQLMRAPLGGGALDLCMLIFLPWTVEWSNGLENALFCLPTALAAIDLCLILFDKQVRQQRLFPSKENAFGNVLFDSVLIVYGSVAFLDADSYRFVGPLVAVAALIDLFFGLKNRAHQAA